MVINDQPIPLASSMERRADDIDRLSEALTAFKDLHELAHDAVSLRGEGGLEGRFANMKSKGGSRGKDKGHAKGHAAEAGHGAPSPSLGLLLSRNGVHR